MKDSRPILMLLLCIGLVSTWIYHLYDKSLYTRQASNTDPMATASIRDSISRLYTDSIARLNGRLANEIGNADSLQSRLETKLAEINRLKLDILSILNKPKVSKQDLVLAKQKVAELQDKIGELNSQNTLIGEEKSQLNIKVQELTQNADSLVLHIRQLSNVNQELVNRISEANVFMASEVKLAAIELTSSGEQETRKIKKADKFVVSFLVQNNVNSFENAEIAIVIIQPDRKVLQNTKWDSGNFDTKMEGRKSYTRLVKFDYDKNDRRVLIFSLEAGQFLKGTYLLQIWHKGVMIGQSTDKLS